MSDRIERVSIVVSKGSLEGVYPALIMANGARMEGIDAQLFFKFFGLDAVIKREIHSLGCNDLGLVHACEHVVHRVRGDEER